MRTINFRTEKALPLKELAKKTDRILRQLYFRGFTGYHENAHFTRLDLGNGVILPTENYPPHQHNPILKRIVEDILSGKEPQMMLVLTDRIHADFRITSEFTDENYIVTLDWFYSGSLALCKYYTGGYTKTANMISRIKPTFARMDEFDRDRLTKIHQDLTTFFEEEKLIRT